MTSERVEWVDLLKGIAIVLVVYGHAARGMQASGAISFNSFWGSIDYIVYSIHMPIFFAASGFLYRGSGRPGYWQKKVVTIMWPYFLWTTIHVLLQAYMSGSGAVNREVSVWRLATIAWDPVSPFWFLYSLFFVFVISALLDSLSIISTLLVALTLMAIFNSFGPEGSPVTDIPYGLLYFTLGRYYATVKEAVTIPRSQLLLAVSVFLIIDFVGIKVQLPVRLNIIATLFGLWSMMRFAKFATQSVASVPVIILGRCSMGIYVMHIIVIAFARAIGNKLHLPPIAILGSCVPLAVLLPVVAQAAINWLSFGQVLGLKTDLTIPLPNAGN
ncbi:acyltransferase family protein [Rhizobium sp. Rhizsp82]|uniref:acyltransferase family protein n=1 Tax=Rhizobium sp. Rhizsp82 TaxID=3243057 RepID=UPI0039B57817